MIIIKGMGQKGKFRACAKANKGKKLPAFRAGMKACLRKK